MPTGKAYVLPSGRAIRLFKPDSSRPWEALEENGMQVVRRPKRGEAGSYQYFRAGLTYVPGFTHADAQALARALNEGDPSTSTSLDADQSTPGA